MTDNEYKIRLSNLKEFSNSRNISWYHPKVQAILMSLHFRWDPVMYFGHVKYEYNNGKVSIYNRNFNNEWDFVKVCSYSEIKTLLQS